MSGVGGDTVVRVSAVDGRGVRAAGPQSVTFVELFFDLVFVFAITQITAKTAHDLTPEGVLRAVLLGWLIWWAWTQFTWTLNPADTTHTGVRVLTLAATAAAFVMAASVPRAFTGEAIWFALPYVVVRGLGLGLQLVVEADAANRAAAFRWAGASVVGLVLVLAGALLDPGLRSAAWLAAIVADLAAATLAGRRGATWSLHPSHLSERHGLIVIIALGESLIVAGTAVAGEAISAGLLAAVGMAIVVACLLWWTYFGWLKEALEHRFAAVAPDRRGELARDAFSLAHFPLIGGVVGFAVAIEETVAHPDDPMPIAFLASLGVGVSLFVAASALSLWRLGGPVLASRLVILVAMAAGLAAVATLPPAVPLGVVAAALLAIAILEEVQPPVPSREASAGH